ncbi:MAG TPA: Fic family protein [Solirubrobacterales bacterium]|nr:Fic family protein [Solirubrobacterales bacterium]
MIDLYAFVAESNRIEGIERPPLDAEVEVHEALLALDRLRPADIENFVRVVADAPLRRHPGMDVWVGPHTPPPGGPEVVTRFAQLVADVNALARDPWAMHVAYETLHPFLDGNGRSGRALWAWQTAHEGRDPFLRPFLHTAYYQALDACRRGGDR